MPLIRVKIKHRNKLNAHIVKHRCEAGTPIADSNMRNLNIKDGSQNKADISVGIFAKIKHGQSGNYDMSGITHSFESVLAKKFRHGRLSKRSVFPNEKGMVAPLVRTAVIAVMLVVVVKKAAFAADRT